MIEIEVTVTRYYFALHLIHLDYFMCYKCSFISLNFKEQDNVGDGLKETIHRISTAVSVTSFPSKVNSEQYGSCDCSTSIDLAVVITA